MIIHGDCIEVMKTMEDNSVDALVTDPPYGLGFMGKEWDTFDNTQFGIAGQEGENDLKVKKNFKILPRIGEGSELQKFTFSWATEALRILRPGAHLISFGGTRTYHRMAVAIEDAGFEVRDMLEWIYASGFPKSLNVGKAVDKIQGNEREEFVHKYASRRVNSINSNASHEYGFDTTKKTDTKGTSAWEGFGTALKPAHEPIILARKPLSEKSIVENVLKHGTGALDIDGTRIPTGEEITNHSRGAESAISKGKYGDSKAQKTHQTGGQVLGRFPANLLVTDDALNDGVVTKSGIRNPNGNPILDVEAGWNQNSMIDKTIRGHSDFGSKSRYFNIDVWAEKNGLLQYPKASKRERNEGLDGTAIVSVEWSIWKDNSTTPGVKKVQLLVGTDILAPRDIDVSGKPRSEDTEWNTMLFGKVVTEKYQQDIKSTILTVTNSTTQSLIFNWLVFLLTKEYTADVSLGTENGGSPVASAENSNILTTTINEKMVSALGVKNVALGTQLKISVSEGKSGHPTVKPVHLMAWLVRLVSKPGDTILDPFAGSGTTLIAALKLGRKAIGIELNEEYCEIARHRLPKQQLL